MYHNVSEAHWHMTSKTAIFSESFTEDNIIVIQLLQYKSFWNVSDWIGDWYRLGDWYILGNWYIFDEND